MIHSTHMAWLEARGIMRETAEKFSIHTHSEGGGNWLRIPYFENGQAINHKWRKTQAKNHRMDKDAPLLLWNHKALKDAADGRLIITEGEWDGLVADQCGWPQVVSVPNGAPQEATQGLWDAKRYEWVHRHQAELDRVKSFVLATDGDNAGRILAADLARLLGPERCLFLTYPDGTKDLNEVLLKCGEDAVNKVLEGAKKYPVRGLYSIEDFPDPPAFAAVPVGIDGLEELWPLVPGTFTVITGWPGHGKSSLVLVAIANLLRQGVPVALGSFETMVKPVLLKRMRAAIYRCDAASPKVHSVGPADEMMAERLRIISNLHVDEETELDIEGIIELARVAVLRDGVRLLVLDPWNEIEHKRGRDESETEYVGRAIRLLKRFGRDYQCAVWVVAHPRKPAHTDGTPKRPSLLDLAGSANFANKADYGLICHRDDLSTAQAEATVTKKRMGLPGAMGRVMLAYNELTSSYDKEML